MAETNYNYGTGRRKTSVARVFMKPARASSSSTTSRWTNISPARPAAWSCASRWC